MIDRGFVCLAQNNQTTDYVRLAQLQCMSIKHHMPDASYTLITDAAGKQTIDHSWFDNVIELSTDWAKDQEWKQRNDWQVGILSPYRQTIVIDVDYLVLTPRLNQLFRIQQDLVLCHDNRLMYKPLESRAVIDPVWATVFYFTKNKKNEAFFYLVGKIQRNWEYYKNFF